MAHDEIVDIIDSALAQYYDHVWTGVAENIIKRLHENDITLWRKAIEEDLEGW